MDNRENSDTKTRQYNHFDISVWKTDDKAWMKERKAGWVEIKEKLNFFHAIRFTGVDVLRFKKDYKFIKQFYLTGLVVTPETIEYDYELKSPLDFAYVDSGALLECWLTPEPSIQKWEAIIARYDVNIPKTHPTTFEMSKNILRKALIVWYTKPEQSSLFGEIETQLTEFFEPFSVDNKRFFWDEMIYYFLYSCGWEDGYYRFNEKLEFNPNHPVYSYDHQIVTSLIDYHELRLKFIKDGRKRELDETKELYEKSPQAFCEGMNYDPSKLSIEDFFDQSKMYVIEKENKKYYKEMVKKIAFLYFISISTDKYHIKQVAFAKSIITGIEQLDVPENLRAAIEKGRKWSTQKKKIKKLMK